MIPTPCTTGLAGKGYREKAEIGKAGKRKPSGWRCGRRGGKQPGSVMEGTPAWPPKPGATAWSGTDLWLPHESVFTARSSAHYLIPFDAESRLSASIFINPLGKSPPNLSKIFQNLPGGICWGLVGGLGTPNRPWRMVYFQTFYHHRWQLPASLQDSGGLRDRDPATGWPANFRGPYGTRRGLCPRTVGGKRMSYA